MSFNIRSWMVERSKRVKRLLTFSADIVVLWAALWGAFYLRLGTDGAINPLQYYWLFLAAPAIAVPIFIRQGLYRAVLRYLGRDAFATIFNAVTISALFLVLLIYWVKSPLLIPRSTVMIYWVLALLGVGGVRYAMREYLIKDRSLLNLGPLETIERIRPDRIPVAIYGAGTAGFQLRSALKLNTVYYPVAFIDASRSLHNRVVGGLKVYAPRRIAGLIEETGAREVMLAMPAISRAKRREILESLEAFPVHVRTVPSIDDLASGRLKVEDIREVDIADILGRDAVTPDPQLLGQCISEQAVMVTGAGGSIGSELCRQIALLRPSCLVLLDHSEFNLYQIEQELQPLLEDTGTPLVALLGSVCDDALLSTVIAKYKLDTIYHAAAYKHVPLVEHNIAEGLRNNVLGTLAVAQAAIAGRVKNFVLISTDKAVRPTNVMGASKRLAEMVLQALSAEAHPLLRPASGQEAVAVKSHTRFVMVRFGNVLGSSGSVIPRFRRQIHNGGPVTVTHPDITRYFMTIPEAAQLVIQAGSMGTGGDVFLLDMGEPVRILDLAEKMVSLSGLMVHDDSRPDGDIAIEFTGLRPGEKLYEELLIGGEVTATAHPKILSAAEERESWATLQGVLDEMQEGLAGRQYHQLRTLLRRVVGGYQPQGEIVDWLQDPPAGVGLPESGPDQPIH